MTLQTQFHAFSNLPAEIRLRIWLLTIRIPRLIEIRTVDYPSNISYLPIPSLLSSPTFTAHSVRQASDIRWTTKIQPPSALSVCRESRDEALKVFTLRFQLLASGPEVIYVNPEIDIVYANFKWFQLLDIFLSDLRAFTTTPRHQIRSLAISKTLFFMHREDLFRSGIPDLEALILVLENEGTVESYWTNWDGREELVGVDKVKGGEEEVREDMVTYWEDRLRKRDEIEIVIKKIKREDKDTDLGAYG